MRLFPISQKRIFSLKIAKKIIISLIFVFIFDFFLFPAPILASETKTAQLNGEYINNATTTPEDPGINNNLPENNDLKILKSGYYTITAYNSVGNQTDGSPCITASGFNLCKHGVEDSVATNFLPFGTRVRIPDIFGDQVFIVRDRMNARFQDRLDVWMIDGKVAKKFGIRVAKIEILAN